MAFSNWQMAVSPEESCFMFVSPFNNLKTYCDVNEKTFTSLRSNLATKLGVTVDFHL